MTWKGQRPFCSFPQPTKKTKTGTFFTTLRFLLWFTNFWGGVEAWWGHPRSKTHQLWCAPFCSPCRVRTVQLPVWRKTQVGSILWRMTYYTWQYLVVRPLITATERAPMWLTKLSYSFLFPEKMLSSQPSQLYHRSYQQKDKRYLSYWYINSSHPLHLRHPHAALGRPPSP